MKINKITLVGFMLIVSFFGFAQESNKSSLSQYGIGEIENQGNITNSAMGGISVTGFSASTLNTENPASLTALKEPTLDFGVVSNSLTTNSVSSSYSSRYSYVKNFAYGFPIAKRLALGFSLSPFSRVGYKLAQENNTSQLTSTTILTGQGGLNNAKGSFAVNLIHDTSQVLSVGATYKYYFGNIAKYRAIEFSNATVDQLNLQEYNQQSITGGNYSIGINYRLRVKNSIIGLAVNFEPSVNLNADLINDIRPFAGPISNGFHVDTIQYSETTTQISMPTSLGFGASAYLGKKWFVAAEYKQSDFNSLSAFFPNQEFTVQNSMNLGAQFIPDAMALSKFFKVMRYRIGAKYAQSGYLVNGNTLSEIGITAGLGIPLIKSVSRSSINLYVEAIERGNKTQNLITERYLNFGIGITVLPHKFDQWFNKRKID